MATLSALKDLGGKGIKVILGDRSVDADGATITLTEGQTEVRFALIQTTDITADATGGLTVTYNNADGQSSTSNQWGINLHDTGATTKTSGHFTRHTCKATRRANHYQNNSCMRLFHGGYRPVLHTNMTPIGI